MPRRRLVPWPVPALVPGVVAGAVPGVVTGIDGLVPEAQSEVAHLLALTYPCLPVLLVSCTL